MADPTLQTDPTATTLQSGAVISDASKGGTGNVITPAALSTTNVAPFTQPVTPEPVLTTPTSSPTLTEAGTTIEKAKALNTELAGKAAYTTEQQAAAGVPEMQKNLTDLTTQLNQLNLESKAIPLTTQEAATGRGVTAGGIAPIQSAATRENAIKALTLSSTIEAVKGNITNAMAIADRAVAAKYAPIEANLKASIDNLNLIKNSPNYTAEQKAQADAQLQVQQQKLDAIALEKTNLSKASDAATLVISQNPHLDATSLQALKAAKSPAEVTAVANALGLIQGKQGRYKDIPGKTITNPDGSQTVTAPQVFDTLVGQVVNTNGKTAVQMNTETASTTGGVTPGSVSTTPGKTGAIGTGPNQLPFERYGLLANTDLNPNNKMDSTAMAYITAWINNGGVSPTTVFGRGATSGYKSDIANRANELYQQATGEPLPNPQQLKEYNKEYNSNNSILNKNILASDTVQKNFDLAIKGEISNDVNKNATIINKILNPIYLALGDPATNQALVSNGTISQEFANLISIRNAQGTLMADKEMASHLLSFGTSVEAQKAVVERLKAEAMNIHDSLLSRNAELMKYTDPLAQRNDNPVRQSIQNHSLVEQSLQKLISTNPAFKGHDYNSILQDMTAKAPANTQPVIEKSTGNIGYATPEEMATGKYVHL